MKSIKPYLISVLRYALFWGVSYWFLLVYFSFDGVITEIDHIYTYLFHISLVFGVLINSFVLIPSFLAKGRFIVYIPLLILTLECLVQINQLTFNHLADFLFPDYFFISYYERWDLYQFMIAYIGLTSLLQFSKSWFDESYARQKLTEMEKERTTIELKSLRAQIQPHTLFNSLNTIYSLTRKKADEAPEAVLMLSDLLRYTMRQGSEEEVLLEKEIEFLAKTIRLHHLRMNKSGGLIFETVGNPENWSIIPLLFIVFVENALKYGVSDDEHPTMVTITCSEKSIKLFVLNSISESMLSVENYGNGLGIENARKRLELHYSGRFHLKHGEENGLYIVHLEIMRS